MTSNQSSGLASLRYEFYKATLLLVGSHLMNAPNGMLEASELGLSLHMGVIPLITKVAGDAYSGPAAAYHRGSHGLSPVTHSVGGAFRGISTWQGDPASSILVCMNT